MTETRSIAYQGEPGANSHIACVDVFPDLTPNSLPDLRGRLRRPAGGLSRSRHDSDRELDRRTGGRHPRAAARLRPAHRRRDLPADPLPAARGSRRADRGPEDGPQPRPCARPVPQRHPPSQAQTGGRQRHRGRGARGGGTGRQNPRRARNRTRRPDLRSADAGQRRRGRESQHDPLRRLVEGPELGALRETAPS